MLNRLRYVAVFAAGCLTTSVGWGSDDVLYWMVEEGAMVHYADGISQHMQNLVPSDIDSSLAARVRVMGSTLTDDTFLDLYYSDGEESFRFPGDMGLDFGDIGSGYWGCGVPTGNQSPITDYSGPEFSFMIEIGHYSYDEDTDTESWTTIAGSASTSYSSLQGYIYTTFDISPPTAGIWSPLDFYAVEPVPEPSSSLLIALGLPFLILRRRRNGHC